MRRYLAVIMLCCVAFILSCSLVRGRSGAGEPPVIRFVNLKYIYDFFINKNKDARDIAKKKEDVIAELKTMETQLNDPKKSSPDLALNYQRKKQLYGVLGKEEDEYKKKISQRIHLAMTGIAEETGVDFILNIGDEVIFGKKKYDITEDVIREVMDIGKRSEPVAR